MRGNVRDLDEMAHFRMTQGDRHGFLMAESLYRTILAMAPSASAHYALASALRASGNISGAIAEMTTGCFISPPGPPLLVLWCSARPPLNCMHNQV